MISKFVKAIMNPKIILFYCLKNIVFRIIPDKFYLKILYRLKFGHKLDLNNPITYNEKLQWLKLNDRRIEQTRLADKIEVRKYVEEKIGSEYLIPLYGEYDKLEDINFDNLPEQYVLKCNHDSGGLIICNNKKASDINAVLQKLRKCLRQNYYYTNREWPYKNIKPRILCEKYMADESGTELKDYKIFCFNGEPKIVQVDFNRYTNHKRNLYDINWCYLDVQYQYPSDPKVMINKPKCLDEMFRLARVLSSDYTHMRVDFYIINDKIYFGEITFFPEAGFGKFIPTDFDTKLGRWVELRNQLV